ncbi:MAG: hypothetical protein ACLRMZ_11520 [Blautia marasmi]
MPVSELEQAADNPVETVRATAIGYTAKDELGHLADSMRSVVDSLLTIIQDESTFTGRNGRW